MRPAKRVVIFLAAFGFLAASCAPAQAPQPTAKPAAPKATEAPAAAAPAAPVQTPKPAVEQPTYGGTINAIIHTDPPTLDIHQEGSAHVQRILAPCYNLLVQYDPFDLDKIVGDLAERWEVSPDGAVFTFNLRQGVKWHDGKPLTAEDVQFSFDRIRRPPRGTISPRQSNLQAIETIETPSASTVRIALRYPQAAFLSMIAAGWEVIVPKHVVEAKGSLKKDVVGTGPFKLGNYVPGGAFEVVKNPDYFVKGRPYLDGVRFYAITDNTTRFAALRTKRIHITSQSNGITAAQAEQIKKDNLSLVVAATKGGSDWSILLRNDVAPWSDPRVRRAVHLALDRQSSVRLVSDGFGDVGGFIPPSTWSIPEEQILKLPGLRQAKDADLAEAKKLMSEAGLAEGVKATMIYRAGSIYERGAVFVRDQLARLGVSVTLEARDYGSYMNLVGERGFSIVAHKDATASPDPEVLLGQRYLSSSPKNYIKFSDPEFDKLFDEQSKAVDPTKRKSTLLKIQERLLEQIPAVVSHWESYIMAYWPEVKNYNPGTTIYSNARWQEVWLAR